MVKVECVYCDSKACTADDLEQTPPFCPRRRAREALDEAGKIRVSDPFVKKVEETARVVGSEGRGKWPRIRELIEFSKQMGIRKIGVAFCVGLREETRVLCRILESHGFEVNSVACTVEGGCNPVGQAMVLNHVGTELNILMGLCMGHDILFSRFSKAPVTTLVVKDRVTCHNPVAPLVCRYWRNSLIKRES